MKHGYNISPALAWQSYDCIDMIIENMLLNRSIPEVFNCCKERNSFTNQIPRLDDIEYGQVPDELLTSNR